MKQTSTVDGCLLVGVSSDLGKNIFFLEELVIGTQTNSQIDSSKIVCQKMRKPKDKAEANEESKQFDPGGKRESHRFESGCTDIIFFFWGMDGLGCPACFFCFCLSACFVSVSFHLLLQEKSGDDHFSAS